MIPDYDADEEEDDDDPQELQFQDDDDPEEILEGVDGGDDVVPGEDEADFDEGSDITDDDQ